MTTRTTQITGSLDMTASTVRRHPAIRVLLYRPRALAAACVMVAAAIAITAAHP